jgi:hypothetical protein
MKTNETRVPPTMSAERDDGLFIHGAYRRIEGSATGPCRKS